VPSPFNVNFLTGFCLFAFVVAARVRGELIFHRRLAAEATQ
jgi:hypothetical protein